MTLNKIDEETVLEFLRNLDPRTARITQRGEDLIILYEEYPGEPIFHDVPKEYVFQKTKRPKYKMTEEHRKNISEGLRRFWSNDEAPKRATEETRKKISEGLRRFYSNNEAPKREVTEVTEETRKKIAEKLKKAWAEGKFTNRKKAYRTEEHNEKIRHALISRRQKLRADKKLHEDNETKG